MVSLKSIALECGVSVATVSKALNDHSDIGAETKKRIRAKAKEMGYLPNFAAQALKTNRTYNIGVLFADQALSGLTHDYFSHVLDSFKVTAEARGYDITFINCAGVGGASRTYLEHVRYRAFDGVCIACIDFDNPQVMELVRSDVPLVAIDHFYEDRVSIMSDNASGMSGLVKYAYDRGHRKIAYIHDIYDKESTVTINRIATFKKQMQELGLDVPDYYFKKCPYRSTEDAYAKTLELLDLEDRPTCILYPDDYSALGGIKAIRLRGLSIPDDISIAGYDGIPVSGLIEPRLTTFVQDTQLIGRRAAESLISLIEDSRSSVMGAVNIPGEICEGGTIAQIG